MDSRPEPRPFIMPSEIGGFQVQRVLGSGGMATVYAALQSNPRRTVALKVMKSGVATEKALRRFQHEVEILGRLHHPCIAQVYAAGVHEDEYGGGQVPYFVMEYVSDASTIIEYIAAKQLDIRERLKLFVKVCAAVEHGHRRHIIHRDLKPGNILIDATGEPKVIDFGVAHATEIDISAQTMHTEAGALVGTLQYMAPEQVHTQLQDLDARCDVYALGAILYKMLTGRPALDLETLPIYEAVRVIREDLPRPPSEVRPEIKGDLETIVLKALEKDRTRRYFNAGSLGRDIVRFLARKPIHARRSGWMYRAALFARRQTFALAAGSVVAIVIAGAVAFVLYDRAQLRTRTGRSPDGVPVTAPTTACSNPASAPTSAPVDPVLATLPKTLNRHVGQITRLAVSPDGRTLVSAAADHLVIVWDLATGRPVHTLPAFNAPVHHLAMNGDGTQLLASTTTGPIVWIDALRGKAREHPRPEIQGVTALALSPRGNLLAVGSNDLSINITPIPQPATDHEDITLRSSSGMFTSLSFSADGAWLVGNTRSDIVVYNIARDESTFRTLDFTTIIASRIVGFPGEGPRCVAVNADGAATIGFLSSEAGDWTTFHAAPNAVIDVAFSSDASLMACATATDIGFWNLSGDSPQEFRAAMTPVAIPLAIAIDGHGAWCAMGDRDGAITVRAVSAQER